MRIDSRTIVIDNAPNVGHPDETFSMEITTHPEDNICEMAIRIKNTDDETIFALFTTVEDFKNLIEKLANPFE